MKRLFTFITLLFIASITHAGSFTDFAENKLVDTIMRGQASGIPASWYIGLDTVACGETGTGTEVTGGSYARVAVTSSLANWAGTQSAGSTTASSGTGGTTSNNGAITFPALGGTWHGASVQVQVRDVFN